MFPLRIHPTVSQAQGNIAAANRTLERLEDMQAENDNTFQRWNSSIVDSMQELRDKIAQARHAAEAIRISVQSQPVAAIAATSAAIETETDEANAETTNNDHSCIRSYIPRTVGLTTANTIRMSIALRPPTPQQPATGNAAGNSQLLFIQGATAGTYLALELRQFRVHLAWNLGGQTGQLTHPTLLQRRDLKFNDAWYQIVVNRTMNLATLSVAQLDQHGTLSAGRSVTGSTDVDHTRLQLSALDSRLWMGGVPDALRPSVLLPPQGASGQPAIVVVHKLHVDDEPVGLWNFAHSQGGCAGAMAGAHQTDGGSSNSVGSWHFNGHGYATVQKKSRQMVPRTRFSMQLIFRTFDENALLFLAVDESTNRSVSLTLHRGRLMFRIDYGNDSKLEIGTAARYNDGNWTKVEVARHFSAGTESGLLTIADREEQSGSPTTPITLKMLPNLSRAVYYLGGVPPGFRSGTTKAPGADHAFLGCMRDIQVNGETYDPMESSAFYGVETMCRQTITMAGFHGSGWLALPAHSLRKRANFGLVLRTEQPDALVLLALAADGTANYSVSLIGGRPHVWLQTASSQPMRLMANRTLNDGEYHGLTVQKSGCRVELRVDDVLQDAARFEAHGCAVQMGAEGRLYLGGAPDTLEKYAAEVAATFDRFAGAIRDVVFNNATMAFDEQQMGFTQVQLGRVGPAMGGLAFRMAADTSAGGTKEKAAADAKATMDTMSATGLAKFSSHAAVGAEDEGTSIGRSFAAVPEGCHRVSD